VFKSVSLFSGCGGLDLGLIKAGFEIIWGIDNDGPAVESYKRNIGSHIIHEDITNVSPTDIPDHEVLVAGFPCQPFSMMGKQLGFEDERGTLFFRIEQILKEKNPSIVILENVKNLLTHDKGATFKKMKTILEKLEYKVFAKVLNSKDYGVPQTRNRVFVVAFKNHNINYRFPEKINLDKTMQDLLEDDVDSKYFLSDKILKTIMASGTKNYSAKSEIDLKIGRPLCATMHKMHRASQDNYVTQYSSKTGKQGVRRLTPRECARLQGFPETYEIKVSDTQAYRQFGNAVTVNVSYYIGLSIIEAIREYEESINIKNK
jgi:DNA (cytosine-5)-methyltransferase 1